LTETRELVGRIERLKRFMDEPGSAWLVYARLARVLKQYERVLAERDALVKRLTARAASAAGREAVIAGGIAARLTTTDGSVSIADTDIREWTAGRLKALRKSVLDMNNEFSLASPARQIEIRNAVLEAGLPGDPAVRRMWASRDASR